MLWLFDVSYLKKFIILKVQEASYGLVRLFSDIGGVLGLWAGISIIALMETFMFVLQLVNVCPIHKDSKENAKLESSIDIGSKQHL